MATIDQATQLGLATPQGTDAWRFGDDAITQNALRFVDLYLALVNGVEAHNTQADALLAEAAALKQYVLDVSGVTVPDDMAALLAGDPDSALRQTLDPILAATYVTRGSAVVDVRDHGAVGDGATDDTAALQAAVDVAASTGPAVVYLPPIGTYRVEGTVTVPGGVTIAGEGSRVQLVNNLPGFSITLGADRVTFRGLAITGTMPADGIATRQVEVGIKGYGSHDAPITNLLVEDCRFDDVQGTAVQLRHVQQFRVRSNRIRRHGYAAIGCHSVRWGWIEHNNIEGTNQLPSYVANSYGVYVSTLESEGPVGSVENPRSCDVMVRGNVVRNQQWSALDTHVGQRISFVDNRVHDCAASGINAVYIDAGGNAANALLSPQDIVMRGNVVTYSAVQETSTLMNMGLLLRGSISTDVANRERATGVIEGNVIRRMGRQDASTSGAIFIGCGAGIVVAHNLIEECRSIGVHVYDCRDTVISHNTFTDLWRSSSLATAVYLNLQLEAGLEVTVIGNRQLRGRLVVGTDLPAGAVVNNSAVNGSSNAAVVVTEAGNRWADGASFAGAQVRQQTTTQRRRVVEGTAPPTSGTWLVGDQIRNTAPASSGYVGWVCVNGGTPGTWRGFGAIAAT